MPDELDSVSRRRFARRQWLRRFSAWRVALSAVLAVVVLLGGVWLVGFSSVLGVSGIDVEGNALVQADRVRTVADVPSGRPLARLDIDAIADRVAALPAVKSVDVSRKWPDRVLIRIEERTVVAVMQVNGTFRGMDETGTVFRTYDRLPTGLPVIRADGELTAEIRIEGAAVVGSLSKQIAKLVEYVELRTVDQIDLKLRDGRTVVWGSAAESAQKAAVLAVLLKERASVYDVAVPGRPTTR